MSIHNSHLNSAVLIIKSYNGTEPFHLFIKKYFASSKKFGSRDRKQISSLCYNYFRLGHSVNHLPPEKKILTGTFLCQNKKSAFIESIMPEWNKLIEQPFKKKLSAIDSQFSLLDIFPYNEELSDGIDRENFNKSFLIQPDLFLRIRPGNNKRVTGKLSGAGISYKIIDENCIALPNSSKVDTIIELDKEAVVQDYNSQRVGEFILPVIPGRSDRVWDCCAASGGKSIMAWDINPEIELTVSDKRESIVQNLHKRFAKAGIKRYNSFIADLTTGNWQQPTAKYDLIIFDAPCTGSGTWARTPEQLLYLKKNDIEKYATLQKKIIEKVIPCLKQGGHLLYITCSVFKKENEEVVNFAQEKFKLNLEKMELFKGYDIKADTLFAALFTAPVI